MTIQALSRSSGRTTIRTTPDSTFVRKCARHSERKAVARRVQKVVKPIPSTVFIPECQECAARKAKAGESIITL